MNKCIQKTEMSEWMTKGKTTLIIKDPIKGTAQTNYRPITCLPIMWIILTAQIKEIFYSLISHGIIPKNRKDAERESEAQRNYYI